MSDLLIGFGLVLVIDGLLWAAVPRLALRLLQMAKATPETQLRIAGLVTLALGIVVIGLVRRWQDL